jgi:long-chain fatty acid transport protein
MKERKRILLIFAVFFITAGFFSGAAWAGGIALYEIGTPDVGLAAAGWAARAQDASTLFKNPAGMSLLSKSELQAGIQAGYANIDFSPDSRTTTSGNDGGNAVGWFPGGSLFYVHKITPDLSVGFGTLAYFGNSLKYDESWVGRYYAQEATLIGYTFMPAVSYRINNWLSVGAGLNAMYGTLKQTVALRNLEAGRDGQLKVEDQDWGFGANLGVIIQPRKGTRIGIDYLSEVKLKFSDRPQFSGIGPGLNAILQNRNFYSKSLDLDIYVPQMVMGSIYQEIGSKWAVMANVGWQQWSQFGKMDVSLAGTTTNSLTTDLNYKDTWHVAGGVMYKPLAAWTFTAGVGYDSSAVDDEDRSVTFPVGETYRLGMGVQWQVKPDVKLGFAYEFAFSPDMSLDKNRGPLAGRISGEYTDVVYSFFALNLSWQF